MVSVLFIFVSFIFTLMIKESLSRKNAKDNIPYFKIINQMKTMNFTYIKTNCREIRDYKLCYDKAVEDLKILNLNDINIIDKLPNKNKRIISDLFYIVGKMDFYGHLKDNPNLEKGLVNIIISSYFGNGKAMYTLYMVFENDLMNQIISSKYFKELLNTVPLLNQISKIERFKMNFNITLSEEEDYNEETREGLAMQFLYASSLDHFPPALNTLGHRILKGYGFNNSCDHALEYYFESANKAIKDITKRKTRNIYEYTSLIDYEYVEKKFLIKTNQKITDTIDYYKFLGKEGDLYHIKKLAEIYLFGKGLKKNYKEAFKWYELGSKLNDTTCIFYLGEMYLNGWGTEVNYEKAKDLFEIASKRNYSKAWNSLGYMHYEGLGFPKNPKKAYDYFKKSAKKDNYKDAIFDIITLMLEEGNPVSNDFFKAYKHAQSIANQGHTYGTYFYSMMSIFQIGSTVTMCDIHIEYLKQVSQRSILEKNKFDLASEYYFEGRYKSSALLYMELAEEGFELAQINAALLLEKHNIFKDQSLQNFLAFKYMKMASKTENIFALLKMADYYYEGFGDLDKDYEKAMTYYKKILKQPSLNQYYLEHARFKLGMMYTYGHGDEKDLLKAYKYFNVTAHSVFTAKYPSLLMMKYIDILNSTSLNSNITKATRSILKGFVSKRWMVYLYISFIVFYISFFSSLLIQKE